MTKRRSRRRLAIVLTALTARSLEAIRPRTSRLRTSCFYLSQRSLIRSYYSTKLKIEPTPALLRQLGSVASTKDTTWIGSFIDIHGLRLLGDLMQTYQARPKCVLAPG